MRVTWGIFLPPRVSELGDLPSPSWEWSGGSSLTWALILRSWFTSSSLIVPGRVSTHKSVYKEDNGASTKHWAPSATVNQRVRTVTARSYFPGFLMELCDPCFQLFFFFSFHVQLQIPALKALPLPLSRVQRTLEAWALSLLQTIKGSLQMIRVWLFSVTYSWSNTMIQEETDIQIQ